MSYLTTAFTPSQEAGQPYPELVADSRLDAFFEDVGYGRTTHIESSSRPGRPQRQIWERVNVLGQGTFGSVWLEHNAQPQLDGTPAFRAVKVLHQQTDTVRGKKYIRELEALAKFSQKRFCQFFVISLGWYELGSSLCIAMEYCEHGDLGRHLFRQGKLPEQEVETICWQLLRGVSFMHENRFTHRDIKPLNILIKAKPPTDHWWVKIADLGLSKRVQELSISTDSSICGTLDFMAPEDRLDPRSLGIERADPCYSDMWSLGITIYFMLTCEKPFNNVVELSSYVRGESPFPVAALDLAGTSRSTTALIQSMLRPTPQDRIGAKQAFEALTMQMNFSAKSLSYSGPVNPDPIAHLSEFVSHLNFMDQDITAPSGNWSTAKAVPPFVNFHASIPQASVFYNSPIQQSQYGFQTGIQVPSVFNQHSGVNFTEAGPDLSVHLQAEREKSIGLKAQVEALTKKLQANERKMNELYETVRLKTETVEATQMALNQEREKTVILEDRLDASRATSSSEKLRVEQLELELTQQKNDNAQAAERLRREEAQIAKLEHRVDMLRTGAADREMKLKAEIETFRTTRSRAIDELNEALSQRQYLETLYNDEQEATSRVTRELQQAQLQNERLENKLDVLRNSNSVSQAQSPSMDLTASTRKISELELEIQSLKGQNRSIRLDRENQSQLQKELRESEGRTREAREELQRERHMRMELEDKHGPLESATPKSISYRQPEPPAIFTPDAYTAEQGANYGTIDNNGNTYTHTYQNMEGMDTLFRDIFGKDGTFHKAFAQNGLYQYDQ